MGLHQFKRAFLFGGLLTAAMGSTGANAAIINFQFDGARGGVAGPAFTGNGVLRSDGTANDDPTTGTASGDWNTVTFTFDSPVPPTPPTATPSKTSGFEDSSGNPVTTTLAFSNLIGQDSCNNCNDALPGMNLSLQPLLNSYLGTLTGDPAPTLIIGNLTPNALYNVYVYGTNGASGAGGAFSINGSATETTSGGPGTGPFTTYANGSDYVVFDKVKADASGNLVLTAGPSTINIGILNGVQVESVPEPTSVGALALSGLGLLARRRRAENSKMRRFPALGPSAEGLSFGECHSPRRLNRGQGKTLRPPKDATTFDRSRKLE